MKLDDLPLAVLVVLHRIAKTRLRAFFADPKAMIALREALERKRSQGD